MPRSSCSSRPTLSFSLQTSLLTAYLYAREREQIRLVFSHDTEQWKTLGELL